MLKRYCGNHTAGSFAINSFNFHDSSRKRNNIRFRFNAWYTRACGCDKNHCQARECAH
jgi:hypothetical protein